MSHNDTRQLSSSSLSEVSTPAASPSLSPSAPPDDTAPPQTSSDPTVSSSVDPPTPTPPSSTPAETSSSQSTSLSLTPSDPSTLAPSTTSTSSSHSSTTLSLTKSPPTTLGLPSTSSSSSTPEFVESTSSKSTPSSSAPTTSFTTIVTTLSDGSVFSTVSPLPTSLQMRPNSNPSSSSSRVGIIAGTTIAVVGFILLVLSLVFCYRKNKLKTLWDSLDLRGGRVRERRGLLEDEDFDEVLTHARGRPDMTASGQGSFTLGGGSINMSVGSTAGHQLGNSPALSDTSARFIDAAIPISTVPISYFPNRSSFPPTTIISTPSSITSSLPAIQPSLSSQTQNQALNSNSTPNYINYNSSVTSFPHSSPPVPSLFRARASESGSIFREEGVWPPPNEKSNDFVDPFIGQVKKVSGEVGDELGKIVRDVMGPSGLGDSGSGSIASPSPSQQPFLSPSPSMMTMLSPSPPRHSSKMHRASFLSAPITPMTVATLGGTSGAADSMGTTEMDGRTGSRKQRQNEDDSPTSIRKWINRRNTSTPSPSSSLGPSISPLPAPPSATANTNPEGTSMGLSSHDTTVFSRRHRSSSSLSLSLPPGAAPSHIPGLSPAIPTPSASTMKLSPTTTISPITPEKSPTSANSTNTANTLNTNASLTMRSEESPVLYKYKDGGMPTVEEDFGRRDAVRNNKRRSNSDGFEFLRGEKVDREVVIQELGILEEDASRAAAGGGGGDVRGGGRSSSPAMARRSLRSMSIPSISPFSTGTDTTTTTAMTATSSSLTLSPTASPTLNPSSQVKKPSPLKQQTLAD